VPPVQVPQELELNADDWWRDRNTPFKEFAEAFVDIGPKVWKDGGRQRVSGDVVRNGVGSSHIDVFGWKL